MNDERLREILRQGDPAEGAGGLTPEEVRAMRRTVLTAAPEPRRRLLPVLALAGGMAAAGLIALALLKPGPVEPPPPPRIAAVPVPSAPSLAPPPPAPAEPPRTEPALRAKGTTARAVHRRHHRRNRPEEAVALASLKPAAPPEEPETRQIQFSTPGGTRIIWILKSGKASR
jgi:hypothetical protein